ncbi:MAG: hypothetical protein ACRDSK_16220 [Actinophytocola sp.]|uniref:hypothetical protein n=1 Tax=Actinophytocola sp. TaxID=1872138 RepID=UPI003D6A3C99
MTRETVMSTPIFDQLLREMAQRAEPMPASAEPPAEQESRDSEQARSSPRRRHRAD